VGGERELGAGCEGELVAAMREGGRILCVGVRGGFLCVESGRNAVLILYFLLRAGQVGWGRVAGGGWSRWLQAGLPFFYILRWTGL